MMTKITSPARMLLATTSTSSRRMSRLAAPPPFSVLPSSGCNNSILQNSSSTLSARGNHQNQNGREYHFSPLLSSSSSSSSSSASSSNDASNNTAESNSKVTISNTINPTKKYATTESTKSETTNIKDRVKLIPLGQAQGVDAQGITHVQLSHSKKLNSLDIPMFEAIAEAASRLREDKKLRVVILSGEGRAFCTGLDAKSVALSGPSKSLSKLLNRPTEYGGKDGLSNLAQDVCYLWRQIPVPVIASLHGMCFGGGLQIALGADMRYSTPDCKLSIMESRWGLIPDMGVSITLRELVRIDVAKELTMTGRIISGLEAEKLGIVTRCTDDPFEEALRVAKEIVERSPDSVALTKELFQTTWVKDDDETCLKKETDLQMKLIGTYNQMAASGRQFGVNLPYFRRRD